MQIADSHHAGIARLAEYSVVPCPLQKVATPPTTSLPWILLFLCLHYCGPTLYNKTLKRARRVQRVDDDMGILAVQLLRTAALRTTTEQECGRGRNGGGVVVD
ncbi:hypothetical protein M430DRAFT_169371 [Amorphotheca resinae ATCC 22711]|uniref:Uncharacterized protein n=1 Tax=Amorphotheca resinae ATCC 22711 TaxID=857342 RepID=A0A2T3AUF8_AMORE|nr:hypothetical protein M430DRAFT_169371 [Amorphotheca resinae ATCC 22711]PSS12305.1 hypothetical protein M430DRAFT_169371 [Amorphotheca resinae ATCC 22711]